MTFAHLSDDALLATLDTLIGSERELIARTVAYLVEIEKRELHLEFAYSSLFDFCRRRLRLSEGEAFRRITAARLATRFPIIVEMIETGAIHLTAVALLRDHLTDKNHARLLAAASGKTKREVEELIAAEHPKPDAPSRIRKLPDAPVTPSASREPDLMPMPAAKQAERPRFEPLSEARYKVQLTASQSLRDKLEHAKNLMSHANPSGDLAVVIERAVDVLIADLEKRKLGKTNAPRPPKPVKDGHVSAAVRRAVFERDGYQCTFVSEAGDRCPAREFLELDHIVMRAHGGPETVENLRVRCRNHNQHSAAVALGREHIEKKIAARRAKLPEDFEKALLALTTSGFRKGPARRVIESLHETGNAYTLEQLVRESLSLLTP